MARAKLTFSGFDDMLERIQRMGGDIKEPIEKALQASVDIITPELQKNIAKHRRTGATEASLQEPRVEWKDNVATAHFGFKVKEGGLPAIFLERGTPTQPATPIVKPAVSKKRKEILKKQEEILTEALRR